MINFYDKTNLREGIRYIELQKIIKTIYEKGGPVTKKGNEGKFWVMNNYFQCNNFNSASTTASTVQWVNW